MGRWAIVTSDLAVEAARQNISARRPECIGMFHGMLDRMDIVATSIFKLPVTMDAGDQPLLCSAIRAGRTDFVTGDRKHFGQLMERDGLLGGVRVMSIKGFTALILKTP